MKKLRVYELAKELRTDTSALMAKMAELDIKVKSHASTLSEEECELIRKEIMGPDPKEVVEKRLKPTLIRRRVKKEAPLPKPTPQAKEEIAAKKVEKPAKKDAEIEGKTPVAETTSKQETKTETKPAPAPVFPKKPKKQDRYSATLVARPSASGDPFQSQNVPSSEAAPQENKLSETEKAIQAEKQKKLKKIEEREKAKRLPKRAYSKPAILRKTKGELPVSDDHETLPRKADVINIEEAKEKKASKKGKVEEKPFKNVVDEVEPVKKKGERKAAGGRRKEFITKKDLVNGRDRPFRPSRKKKKIINKKALGKTEITVPKASKRVIKIDDAITVSELSKRMGIKASDVMRKLMELGIMATINQSIGVDEATLLATEYEYEVENVTIEEADFFLEEDVNPEDMVPRPPVVTIMGHVDHGKTSLLDAIRETRVTEGEKGGITQHIGAYSAKVKDQVITFLDTPGHEAFTAMRARGAYATDIVVLVVAAEDGVMPQTVEAIDHAKAAEVPIVVAINKIDKPDAKPEIVQRKLAEMGLQPEDWGGETLYALVSAKQRTGIEELLETILLQAEVLELKANPKQVARGVVIEAKMERGRGPVATVLVQEGTLRAGNIVVSGSVYGNARALVNDLGDKVESAGPSMPVEVLGLSGLPKAGEPFNVVKEERVAKQVTQHRLIKERQRESAAMPLAKTSLEDLYSQIEQGEAKELKVIIKADVQGSAEALSESLTGLSTDRCKLSVIHSAPGGINENDVNLAIASSAVIIGFNVKAEANAAQLASREGIELRLFSVIYDAIDEIRKAMEGLLDPTLVTKQLGTAEVREIFNISKVGAIAGCLVTEGKIQRSSKVRLIRAKEVIFDGKISTLKRFKDDVKEVSQGLECGIRIENFNNLQAGDLIEAFTVEETPTALN